MPAFSFKERFVPMIKDGTKRQTVRTFRKYPVKIGQLAHLYYGMRTKYCVRLIEPPVINDVICVVITQHGQLYKIYTNWLTESERNGIYRNVFPDYRKERLDDKDRDLFAYNDGFRHSDAPERYKGCFDIMLRWWEQNNDLPFIGFITYW